MNNNTRPYALSIAGFDPTGGAGVLADIKAMEANGVYGMGVVTALTYQNDIDFQGVDWVSIEQIKNQIGLLLQRFDIKYIKIGLIESWVTLMELVTYLHEQIKEPVIVYDPVLKATAGYQFHNPNNWQLPFLMKAITCLTPNIPEATMIFGSASLGNMQQFANEAAIYLKGGHGDEEQVTDRLNTANDEVKFINDKLPKGEKHGSGCVLSSALLAQLALGNDIQEAAKQANRYTYQFLKSNETLLGYHQPLTT
jgi:hydroxymethylpyrimidine/phosphomethylpyrimidine kinase